LLIIPLAMLVSRLGLVTWVTNLAAGSTRSNMVVQTWYQGGGYSLVEMRLGPNHALVGKSLKQMDSDIQVLFIERADGVWAKPTSDDVLRVGDRILCYGSSTNHLIEGTGA
jgi:Trk K+ transport system NAD-binding subunit